MIRFLIGLLVLGIVVVIHEFGHFIAAKLCGVTVESFSVGWGPVLLRKKKGNNRIPLIRYSARRLLRHERGTGF